MCGITGFIRFGKDSKYSSKDVIDLMTNELSHRGPDSQGIWVSEDNKVALGHRRLSIIELTEKGAQPMKSISGRFTIVFNGEIYNHKSIREKLSRDLKVNYWRGNSDTETLLSAIENFGIEKTLSLINGMFAFAIFDKLKNTLIIARDRFGEKPIYFGNLNNDIVFSSEITPIKSNNNWHLEIEKESVPLYLQFGYIPAPMSIYKNLYKLLPGNYVSIDINNGFISEQKEYWSILNIYNNENKITNNVNINEIINSTEEKIKDSISLRMLSDVPIGAFLSGGIDSSLISCLMQSISSSKIKTFTIGFDVAGYNEADIAKQVANLLGTEHTELYLDSNDALSVIPSLSKIWDEPFGDSSQIPTLLLSRMAVEHVKVCLSGDGADEIFCGYNRYCKGYSIYKKLSLMPRFIRELISNIILYIPSRKIDSILSSIKSISRIPVLEERLYKLNKVLNIKNQYDFYLYLCSIFNQPNKLMNFDTNNEYKYFYHENWPAHSNFRELMMIMDTLTYLPGDILTKVDRASMSQSLECRAPYLDHHLVEWAWKLPFKYKYCSGKNKWILRKILEKYIPNKIINRPKMGFGVPIDRWLKGPLKTWAGDLLTKETIEKHNILDSNMVNNCFNQYINEGKGMHHKIWSILMFQSWINE